MFADALSNFDPRMRNINTKWDQIHANVITQFNHSFFKLLFN